MTIQRFGLPLVLLLVIPASAVLYGAWQGNSVLCRATVIVGFPFVLAILLPLLFMG
jgi:hypothetical protein